MIGHSDFSPRSRNVGRNILYGIINRFFALLMPFIVRTVLIYRYGIIYLGMNSLLASIFQVLNLAEFGFGSAVVYSLYLPIAVGDTETVCAYLGTYRKIYRAIGGVIFILGIAFLPFFPWLLKSNEIPGNVDPFIWYLFFLLDAVASYLLFGYKTAIPSALQRNDLVSKIDTVVLFCKSVVQILILLFTDNFYFFLITTLLFTIVRNILISGMVSRYYPQYVCWGSIGRERIIELRRLVCGLALSNFRGASRHSIDSICITVFVGLTMTAIYDNYFCILSAAIAVMGGVGDAMLSSVGNSIATESREKTYCDMRRFNFIYMLLSGWLAVCLFCLYQPFVRLWVGPDLMLGSSEVVALCLYFYILRAGSIRWIYHQGAGLWWKARYIVIAETICNIVLNILLAKYWGVLGIILATLISLFFVNFIGGAWILFKEYFQNGKSGEFFADQARYFLVTAMVGMVCFYICEMLAGDAGVICTWSCGGFVNGYLASVGSGLAGVTLVPGSYAVGTVIAGKGVEVLCLMLRLFICTAVTALLYYLVYHRSSQYLDAKDWLWNRYRVMRGR